MPNENIKDKNSPVKPGENDQLLDVTENTSSDEANDSQSAPSDEGMNDQAEKTVVDNNATMNNLGEQEYSDAKPDGVTVGGEVKNEVKKSKTSYSNLGSSNQAMTLRSVPTIDREASYVSDETTFNDLDAYQRDLAAKERGLKKIEATIIREGTEVKSYEVQDADDAGAAVFDLPNHIVKKITGGVDTYSGVDSQGNDQRATLLIGKDGLVRLGDTIIHASQSADGYAEGLDTIKKFEGYECILLNLMNSAGEVLTYQADSAYNGPTTANSSVDYDNEQGGFVLIRTGNYLVRGVKPFKPVDQWSAGDSRPILKYRRKIGTIRRVSANGTPFDIPVYVSTMDLFDVVELTPTAADIISDGSDPDDIRLRKDLICNDTREVMTSIQRMDSYISKLVANLNDSSDISDVKEFNSYSPTWRSTISRNKHNAFRYCDQSCYNPAGSILYALRQIQQMEALWLVPRLPFGLKPSDNIFDDIKAHKYLEGKRPSFDYAINVAGINAGTNYKMPTLLNYWATETKHKHDSIEKVLFESRGLLSKLDNIAATYDKWLTSDYMTKIHFFQDKVEEIIDILATGKYDGVDTVSTNTIVKKLGEVGLVFGINPNDLVQYDTTTRVSGSGRELVNKVRLGVGSGAVNCYRLYPWAGWRNSTFVNEVPSERMDYVFAPTFITALCEGLTEKNSDVLNRIFAKSDGSDNMVTAVQYGEAYYPFTLHTKVPRFIDVAMFHLLVDTSTDTIRGYTNKNGVLRLMNVLAKYNDANLNLFDGMNISMKDTFSKIINNKQCYPQANATSAQDYPVLFKSAQEFMEFDRDEYQIGVFSNPTKSVLIYEADPRDKHQKFYDDMFNANFAPKNIYELLKALDDNDIMLAKMAEHEYLVCPYTSGDASNLMPFVFTRKFVDNREFGKAVPVLRSGATALDGEDQSAVESYFGHDDHYWINEHKYVMIVRSHYASTDDVPGLQDGDFSYIANKLDWDVSFHPVAIVDTEKRNGDVELFTGEYSIQDVTSLPNILVKFPDLWEHNKNILTPNVSEIGTTNLPTNYFYITRNNRIAEADGNLYSVANRNYECDFIKRVVLPSLYGHKFRCGNKLIDYCYETPQHENYRKIVWSPYITEVNGERRVTARAIFSASATDCKHYEGEDSLHTVISAEIYAPYTVLDNVDNLLDSNIVDILTRGTCSDGRRGYLLADNQYAIRLEDERYYARTISKYYHEKERKTAEADYDYEIFRLHIALAQYGYLLSYDGYGLVSHMTLGGLNVENNSRNARIHCLSIPNKFNPTVAILINDYFTKFGPNRPIMHFPMTGVFCCYKNMATDNDVFTFMMAPRNGQTNPVMGSKYYIDGYTYTNFYNMVANYNNYWEQYLVSKTKMADTFFKKKAEE